MGHGGAAGIHVDALDEPFHPLAQDSVLVGGAEWITAKLARELGIIVTGGSSSVADSYNFV